MARTEEIEIEREELQVLGRLLNVRFVFYYQMDEDGVCYSRMGTGQAWSDRRVKWVDMSRNLLDVIYNAWYRIFEDEAFDRHEENGTSWEEERLLRRDYYKDLLSGADLAAFRG